ncbi:hypothetical protein D3C84_726970 [compost metagenome]
MPSVGQLLLHALQGQALVFGVARPQVAQLAPGSPLLGEASGAAQEPPEHGERRQTERAQTPETGRQPRDGIAREAVESDQPGDH